MGVKLEGMQAMKASSSNDELFIKIYDLVE